MQTDSAKTQRSTAHSTKQDILNYLLRQDQATAQELAEHLAISPQAIRRHLKDLEAEDLILHQIQHSGTGRPSHIYELSQAGRDRFPARYHEFALSLLDTLAETVGEDQVGTILRKQWQRKALDYRAQIGSGSLKERIARLVELRRAEGFMAEWHVPEEEAGSGSTADSRPIEPVAGDRYLITEYNCAISQIAESFPTVCGHELEMFALALPDCQVERTHWLVNGEHRCGYLVQPIVPPSETDGL